MKRFLLVLFLTLILSITQNSSEAANLVFPLNLRSLDHGSYYTWGINWSLPQGQVITGAKITFKNIWDWTRENNDHLYIHLLDNTRTGLRRGSDTTSGDQFAGRGVLIGDWSDPVGGRSRGFNLVYDLGALGYLDELNAYATTPRINGRANFGFGLDADCHYNDNGIKFNITTAAVPEPASLSLLGLGLLGLAPLRKRRDRR